MLATNSKAPTFKLQTHLNQEFQLDLAVWNFLWWYPKASTPTCTKEGCALQNTIKSFSDHGCVIAGLSYDTPEDNKIFAEEYGFEFPLLSDVDRKVSQQYEAVRSPDDQYADMPLRISYLIAPSGKIAAAYEVTDAPNHASQVLDDLELYKQK